MAKVAARPAGSSFFSDFGAGLAGFASGMKKEKERQKQEALDIAMRKFEENYKLAQLGLAERGASLNEAQFDLQSKNAQREAEHQQAMRAIQRGQLAEIERKNREDEAFERSQLAQEKELRYAEFQNRIRVAEIQARAASSRGDSNGALQFLNSLTADVAREIDDARQNMRALESGPGGAYILGYKQAPTRYRAQLTDRAAKGDTQAADQLELLNEYDSYRKRLSESLDKQAKYRGLREKIGFGSLLDMNIDTDNPAPNRWGGLSPEQQLQSEQMAIAKMQQDLASGKPINTDLLEEFGVPLEKIEEWKTKAGVLPPPVTASPADAGVFLGATDSPMALEAAASGLPSPVPPSPANQRTMAPVGVMQPSGAINNPMAKAPVPDTAAAGVPITNAQPTAPITGAIDAVNRAMGQVPNAIAQAPGAVGRFMTGAKSPEAAALERGRMALGRGESIVSILAGEPNPKIRKMLADSLGMHRIPR